MAEAVRALHVSPRTEQNKACQVLTSLDLKNGHISNRLRQDSLKQAEIRPASKSQFKELGYSSADIAAFKIFTLSAAILKGMCTYVLKHPILHRMFIHWQS